MSRLAAMVTITAILAAPASAGWRDEAIDGSSAIAFEQSVVQLLNELPHRRREEFEMALALVWIANTVNLGDSDPSEDADLDEVRLLMEFAEGLLSEVQRGDVLSAIEKREAQGSGYTTVEYFEQLDGLQYDGVVNLAEQLSNGPDLRNLKREAWCREERQFIGAARARWSQCDNAAIHCTSGNCVSMYAARALDAALEAIKAERYADARTEIEQLDFDRLTPHEQSMAEQRLAQISYEEQDYTRMREHLRNAIYAGGLSAEQESALRSTISRLDAYLSGSQGPESRPR